MSPPSPLRLVQFLDSAAERRVGRVKGDALEVLGGVRSTRALALAAIEAGQSLASQASECRLEATVSYSAARSDGRLLSPVDHPDPQHLLVSGTGLTHTGSAETRDSMHRSTQREALTDSAKLFQLGLEQGKPVDGRVGVQPEWFYKGNGHIVARPGHPLRVPSFSLDAGEEPEIVGLYLVASDGAPYRLGYALGNELSDHLTERSNYLYLAHSKLRPCSFGPELLCGALPADTRGRSSILRDGDVLWSKPFASGEDNMSHFISGLEHHHFKYECFRQPGQVHAHFFGTATLSFADGIETRPGDVFKIECPSFGAPLENPLERSRCPEQASVRVL